MLMLNFSHSMGLHSLHRSGWKKTWTVFSYHPLHRPSARYAGRPWSRKLFICRFHNSGYSGLGGSSHWEQALVDSAVDTALDIWSGINKIVYEVEESQKVKMLSPVETKLEEMLIKL
jgi:hypothetical protein